MSKLKTSRGYVIRETSKRPVSYVDSSSTMSALRFTDTAQFALRVKTMSQAIQLLKVLRENTSFSESLAEAEVVLCPVRLMGDYPKCTLVDQYTSVLDSQEEPTRYRNFFVIEGSQGMWVDCYDQQNSGADPIQWTDDPDLFLTFNTKYEAISYLETLAKSRLPSNITCSITAKSLPVEVVASNESIKKETVIVKNIAPFDPPLGILDHWESDLKLLKQQLFDLGHEAHTHRYSILAMEALRLSMCISDLQKVLLKP